ncbi:MAG: transposase [Actinomycetota bacterium]
MRYPSATHKSRLPGRLQATVAVEPVTGIITDASLTAANTAGGPSGVKLLKSEEPGLSVLADSAYGSGKVRADLKAAQHTPVIKPLPLTMAVAGGGFTRDDFKVDQQAKKVTCPAVHTVDINPKGPEP